MAGPDYVVCDRLKLLPPDEGAVYTTPISISASRMGGGFPQK